MSNSELSRKAIALAKILKKGKISALKDFGDNCSELAFLREDDRFVDLTVVAYASAKFFEKPYIRHSPQWRVLVKKISKSLEKSAGLIKKDESFFEREIESVIDDVKGLSKVLGRFLVNYVDKARIKAATQMYAHGASLGKAAELAQVNKQDLAFYIGQTTLSEKYQTISVRQRLGKTEELFK
ncbi:MAG: hypothetical protein ACE5DI_04310 [Candidatus Micrarchaeia archaeon]